MAPFPLGSAPSSVMARPQRLSHARLLQLPERESRTSAGLDAIIVPAARPSRNLSTAIDLANASDCCLVALCSKDADPRHVRSICDARGLRQGVVVKVPSGYRHRLLKFETTDWISGAGEIVRAGRQSDLSTKRNLGLLIARMLKWHRVLFLDDDIRGITVSDLRRTASLLGENGTGNRCAGIRVKHFPDNSVICHARRRAGEGQDVFVTGSVLAVDCSAPFSFFPDIYNEDWLFFYENVKAGKVASPDMHATKKELQIRYNPFADSQRAAREEFGDVIAEGLYSGLHQESRLFPVGEAYWEEFIEARRDLETDLLDRIQRLPGSGLAEIEKSLLTALDALRNITPHMCVEYLATWQRDVTQWEARVEQLPQKGSAAEALEFLKLASDKSCPLCDHSTRAHQGTQRGRLARPARRETHRAPGIAGGVHLRSRPRGRVSEGTVARRIHPGKVAGLPRRQYSHRTHRDNP